MTKTTLKIVTMCKECAKEIQDKGIPVIPYTFKNATTKPKDRCEACKGRRVNLGMYIM